MISCKHFLWLIIVLGFTAYYLHVNASESPVQLYAVAGIDPPNTLIDENGEFAGLAVEKVKSFLDKSGLDYEIELMPWARALRTTNTSNNTVIFNMGRTPSREKLFHWILPLSKFTDTLISKNTPEMVKLSKEEILSGDYTAACERGSLQCESLFKFGFNKDKVTQVSNTTPEKLVELVVKGRVDFVVINQKIIDSGPATIDANEDDIYVHTELHTKEAYMAAPISISPTLLDKLKSTTTPTP